MPLTTLTETDITNLIDTYSQRIANALSARTDQEREWQEWMRIYEGTPREERKDFPWEDASNLVVGLAGTYTDVTVARIVGSIFATKPHWVITQLNKQWARHAKPLEQYMDWAARRMWDQRKVVKQATIEMCKLGTAILFTGWTDTTHYGILPGEEEMAIQEQRHQIPLRVRGHYAGPTPLWVPRNDWLLAPGFTDLQSAPWVAYRQWFDPIQLQAMQFDKYLDRTERVLEHAGDLLDDVHQARLNSRDQLAASPWLGEDKLYAPWQVWFREDLDEDGYPEPYVMLLHPGSKTLMRVRSVFYPWGMRPFVKATLVERPGSFDGIGIPEQVQMYQEEASTSHNQRIDNNTLANNPGIKARRTAGLKQREKAYVGRIWLVTDTSDIEPFALGRPMSNQVVDEQFTITLAERRVGISDMSIGRENSPLGRAAATTVVSLMQENTRRFDLAIADLRTALSEQGAQILEMWQTHGLPPTDADWSPEQVLDPENAVLVREILGRQEGVRGVIGVDVNVATAAVNREVEKQSTLQLFGLMTQYFERVLGIVPLLANPQTPPPIQEMVKRAVSGMDQVLQRIFSAHEVYDLDSVLLGEVLQQMQQPMPSIPAPGGPIQDRPASQSMAGGNGLTALLGGGPGGERL